MRPESATDRTPGASALFGIFLACAAASSVPSGQTNAAMYALGQRLPSISNFGRNATHRPMRTIQQMVVGLRDGGIPISVIADALRVERKTVYSWINGTDARGSNVQRLTKIDSLLTMFADVDIRQIYRFWNTSVDGSRTLRDLMTAPALDEPAISRALMSIRPAALKAMASKGRIGHSGQANPIMDEIPEVGWGG